MKWQENNPEANEKRIENHKQTFKRKYKKRKNAKKQRENGYQKEYQQKYKDKLQLYALNRKMNKKHEISKDEWELCLDYFNHSCAYCGISEQEAKCTQGNYLHKEHVNHEGTNDLSNCIPSCKSCNSQKWKFTLDEWYNTDNPIFSQERLEKIYKWLNEDYKKYIK